MRALDRKLLRDVRRLAGPAAAIALVLACGVATCVLSLSTLSSLRRTRDAYYERTRFAHVFAHVRRAPLALLERIRELPGVAAADVRIVRQVSLDVPGLDEPAVGRVISLPRSGQPTLDLLHVRAGRLPDRSAGGEVLVSEAFAAANGLLPGATLSALLNGRERTLHVVGVALSPEYVISMNAGDVLPDDRRFGVLWMARREVEAAFDMEGAFDDVTVLLQHGASEPEVIRRLDLLLAPHGSTGAHGRREHLSARFLDEELRQLRAMALVAPAMFLAVAAFLVHVVLARLVRTERAQIATLRAFGYGRGAITRHYLALALLVAAVGVALGVGVGARMGMHLTETYTRFYRFPLLLYRLDPEVVLLTCGVGLAAGAAGAVSAVRAAAARPPAEALRPEGPAVYRPALLERLGLTAMVPFAGRMALRQLERTPWRASLSATAVALAVSILVLGNFGRDALDHMLDLEFSRAGRQDVTVAFVDTLSGAALHDVTHLPGVVLAEPFRAVPARIRSGHRSHRLAVEGIPRDAALTRRLDADGAAAEIPQRGLLVSRALAELLHAAPGERVRLEILEGRRRTLEVALVGVVDDFAGMRATMDLDALRALLGEQATASGAQLTVDGNALPTLLASIRTTPRIAATNVRAAAVRGFRETIAENIETMRLVNVVFASIIAAGVVYNTARIGLAERARDLATLRVLGHTRGEAAAVLLTEQAIVVLVGIGPGLLLGRVLAGLVAAALETELYRFPVVVWPRTYAFAAAVTLGAALLAAFAVRRHVARLDPLEALETPE